MKYTIFATLSLAVAVSARPSFSSTKRAEFTLKNGEEQEARDAALRGVKQEYWHGADLGLYSSNEPRVLFAYDADEAGAEWWQTWGILRERARPAEPLDKPIRVGVEVLVEAAAN